MVQPITLSLGTKYPFHSATTNLSIPLLAFKILAEPTHSTLGYMGPNIYTAALLMVPIYLVSVMKGCLTMSDFLFVQKTSW